MRDAQSSTACPARSAKDDVCGRPAGQEGLCDQHLAAVEARLLKGFLADRACGKPTPSGEPCAGVPKGWDVCAKHGQTLARIAFRNVADEVAVERPRLSEVTAAEARDRLQSILDRRRFVPVGYEPYVIPYETLTIKGAKAIGPSLVEGDADVEFVYFEKTGRTVVAAYGPRGSKAGKDMPLVSSELYREIKHYLKHLPGFTERCIETGLPLPQPIYPVSIALLRGHLGIEDIQWRQRRYDEQLTKHRTAEPMNAEPTALDVAAVYAAFGPKLRDLALRRTSDSDLADEIVQETFLRVVQFRHAFVEGRPVWPWLSTIAHNVWASILRQRGQRPLVVPLDDVPEQTLSRALPDSRPEQLASLTRDEILSGLAPRFRRTLELHRAGYSLTEIAAHEGATEKAARNVLYRTRRAIESSVRRADIGVSRKTG